MNHDTHYAPQKSDVQLVYTYKQHDDDDDDEYILDIHVKTRNLIKCRKYVQSLQSLKQDVNFVLNWRMEFPGNLVN